MHYLAYITYCSTVLLHISSLNGIEVNFKPNKITDPNVVKQSNRNDPEFFKQSKKVDPDFLTANYPDVLEESIIDDPDVFEQSKVNDPDFLKQSNKADLDFLKENYLAVLEESIITELKRFKTNGQDFLEESIIKQSKANHPDVSEESIIDDPDILERIRATDADILEDASLDTFSLIRKYKYPCQIHRVYTEDGYILEIHRIPHGRYNEDLGPRPVVYLQHGLLSSSAEWVLMRPGKGFAYILADAGYDVWMGNARGNTYSRRHASIKPTSSSFWKFSWHEIGYYDLPASIDYVLKETGVPKLQYIGFSQGTTAFWVMASTRPEYNDKISAMQALAPVAYVGNIRSPLIKAIAPFTNSLERVFKLLGANEFLPNGKINELAGQRLCLEESIMQGLCTNLLFLICGFNADQLNTTTLPIVLGHTPAGASTRQLIHYGQLYKSKKFIQFDHGFMKNKRKYGTYKPPAYNLRAIRTPVFLHYADNDWLATPKDVDRLMKATPSVIGKYRVAMPKFNHLDFVFGIDADTLVYDRVMKIMELFR